MTEEEARRHADGLALSVGDERIRVAVSDHGHGWSALEPADTRRSSDWGLYLVTLSCLTKIARSVLTAWMLIFSLSHVQGAGRK